MALKHWTNGDVFYGSDMDDLVKASNMRFTNVAQRDAVLTGDLAPAVGMMAFAQDTNLTGRYTDVSGTRFWAPQPDALLFRSGQQSAQQSINTNTMTVLTNWNTDPSHAKTHPWFNAATGRFTPQWPGFYEFTCACVFYHDTNSAGYRAIGVRLNSASAFVAGTGGSQGGSNKTYAYVWVQAPTSAVYLNGTTDYVEIGVQQTSGSPILVQKTAYESSNVSIKYLGR